MIKIEKNEMKQVKSFFKFAKKEYQYAKGKWDPNAYLIIDTNFQHLYFQVMYHVADDYVNYVNRKALRLKIENMEQEKLVKSLILPINFIDVLEACSEILIDQTSNTINSIAIPQYTPGSADLEPIPYIEALTGGACVTTLEKTMSITFNKEKFADLKNFVASNKNKSDHKGFNFYYFEDKGKATSTIQFTDGKRLNILNKNFEVKTYPDCTQARFMLLDQDYMKLLISTMDSILKAKDGIEITAEYGLCYSNYHRLTNIEVSSWKGGSPAQFNFMFSIPGDEETFPDTAKVMDYNKENETMVEILLDPKAREETKKLESLKAYLKDGITLNIENETIKLCGTLRNKQEEDTGSYEIDLTHLACIENKSPEPVRLKLPLSNFLSMIKEIGTRTATLFINAIDAPILYKTAQTEGLCTTIRPR